MIESTFKKINTGLHYSSSTLHDKLMSNQNAAHQVSQVQKSDIPAYTPKQEAILQGAVRIFLRSGYDGTSMDRVAVEAEVSKQTIYSHFRDKEGLFKALMERMTIRRFQQEFHMATLEGDPEVLLRQFAEAYLSKIVDEEYVAVFRLILAESSRFPDLAKLYSSTVIQQSRCLVADYFRRHPELGFSDAEAISQIFIGSLVSYIVAQEIFYGKETAPLSHDRLISSLMVLMLGQREHNSNNL
jgi:AcrR family transcriptional regulator